LARGSVSLALQLGLSGLVIGLTVVALGTSTPELAVRVKAALAGSFAISLENVVGSNIFNILCILGVSSLVHPIEMAGISFIDAGVTIAIAIMILPMARSGFLLTRWEGTILLAVYGGYVYYLSGAAPYLDASCSDVYPCNGSVCTVVSRIHSASP